MATHSRTRISSQELAQLQLPANAPDLPSRESFTQIQAKLASDKPFSRNEWEDVRCMLRRFPQCKTDSYYRRFDLVAGEVALDGKGDLWLPLHSPGAAVLLYQGRIAVPQELLYDALCYCHTEAGHGDKVLMKATVKKHYVFVTKQAIREFLEACPGCVAQRAAKDPSPLVAQFNAKPETQKEKINITLSNSFDLLATLDHNQDEELAAALLASSPFTFSNIIPGTPDLQSDVDLPSPPPLFSRMSTASKGSGDSLQSLPMSREVSLFQGIPNGWQFRDFPTYDDAQKDFLEHKNELMSGQPSSGLNKKRPRIPSIAPLRSTNFTNAGSEGPVKIQTIPQDDSSAQNSENRYNTVVL